MTPIQRINAAKKELAAAHKELVEALAKDKTRRRGAIVREIHSLRQMLDDGYQYTSQAGQDRIIDSLMGEKPGVFIDVGGYDGVRGSNTLFLEQIRGWTGVLVEPVTSQIDKASIARKCPCLSYAVAPEDGTASFIAVTEGFTQMSGLAAHYDPNLLERVRKDPRHKEETVEVETRTLSRILKESGYENPDFVSLDIEGGELAVLKGFDFKAHKVRFWAIENNSNSPEIANLMTKNGYELIEFCGPDEIYRLVA